MNGKAPRSRFFPWTVMVALLWLCANTGVANDSPVEPMFGSQIIEDSDPVGAIRRPSPVADPRRYKVTLYTDSKDEEGPALLYNSVSRLPIVAWSKKTAGGFDVVVSYFDNGTWSTPAVVVANATVTEHGRPRLVVSPLDGSVHLLYWENESAPRVMHRQAPADLSFWSAPVQVSAPGEVAKRPAGVFHDGLLHVVYESHGPGQSGSPRLMVLATQSGSTFTTETLGGSSYREPNWIQVHSRKGELWVDWIDDDDSMCWTTRQASGSWGPIQTERFSRIEQRDSRVRGAIMRQVLD